MRFLALRAAQPRDFNVGGNSYTQWTRTELEGSLAEALIGQAKNCDLNIRENINILSDNARKIEISFKLIASAPLCALISGTIAYHAFDLLRPPVPSA